MRLKVTAAELDRMHAELARAYPDEGCGVLLGRDGEDGRDVLRAVGVGNAKPESRANRYLIAPEDVVAAERLARDAGLDIVGFYHSHPDHPARPSAFDLEHAWPWYSYVIVSVLAGRPAETTAWRLVDDRSRFEPDVVDVATEPGGSGGHRP